jgi:hypothetical protein
LARALKPEMLAQPGPEANLRHRKHCFWTDDVFFAEAAASLY